MALIFLGTLNFKIALLSRGERIIISLLRLVTCLNEGLDDRLLSHQCNNG